MLAGRPAPEFLPRTLSACNEGTQSIRQISLDASRIELGLHYHRDCRVDRQALGTLTGFRAWSVARYPQLDAAIARAAAGAGVFVRRDKSATVTTCATSTGPLRHPSWGAGRWGDFASWRVYLYDRAAKGATQRLEIVTHGGSTAFANPTATMLRDPEGRDAVMVTMFVPMEGAAPGEAGSLLYLVPLDRRIRPPPRDPAALSSGSALTDRRYGLSATAVGAVLHRTRHQAGAPGP